MSTPQEYRRVADELAALRTAIENLATEVESFADGLAISYQDPDRRLAAVHPYRVTVFKLRALLDAR